jgi:hypothetical protein
VFTPRYPATRTGRSEIDAAEAHLDVQGLVKAAVAEATREDVLPDWNDVG